VGVFKDKDVKMVLDQIRDEKTSLASIIYNEPWEEFSDVISFNSPYVTKEGELIITSLDSNNYYDDGYSFYRANIADVTQVPVKKQLEIRGKRSLIVNKAIYYGCTFEAEVENLNHESFNENQISITTYTSPLIRQTMLGKIFFKQQQLQDLKRNKCDIISFQSSIHKFSRSREERKNNQHDFDKKYEIFLDSEIKFDR
tara:strand:- start:614 stop:1210 length:597 start_codon:yes stop_codon:yes gene_type:complete